LRGARLVSDAPLTETERWMLGLGGLVQVVVFLLGVRAGLRSLGRGGAAAGRMRTAPGPGVGGSGAASEFGDMTGMHRTEVDGFSASAWSKRLKDCWRLHAVSFS
jgi:hypothetical protein